jgi:Dullard-like phosphatase family protein
METKLPINERNGSSNVNSEATQALLLSPSKISKDLEFEVQKKKILLLDLDETLVRVFTKKPDSPNYGQVNEVTYTTLDGLQTIYVIERPHLRELITQASQHYSIYIYTASLSEYAEAIVNQLEISKFILGIYSREHCKLVSENSYEKNIFSFGFEESSLIFVDDWKNQTTHAPENSINIQFFNGRSSDNELLQLNGFLTKVAKETDVRPVEEKYCEFKAERSGTSSPVESRQTKASILSWIQSEMATAKANS